MVPVGVVARTSPVNDDHWLSESPSEPSRWVAMSQLPLVLTVTTVRWWLDWSKTWRAATGSVTSADIGSWNSASSVVVERLAKGGSKWARRTSLLPTTRTGRLLPVAVLSPTTLGSSSTELICCMPATTWTAASSSTAVLSASATWKVGSMAAGSAGKPPVPPDFNVTLTQDRGSTVKFMTRPPLLQPPTGQYETTRANGVLLEIAGLGMVNCCES